MALSRLFPRKLYHRLALHVWGLSIGVRGVLTDETGRILLVRHTYLPGWHFPGGGVAPGETARSAIRREIAEEAQIVLTDAPVLAGIYLNRRMHHRDHVLLFRCGGWRRIHEFRASLEIADAGFFPIHDLPADLSRGTARRVAELFGNAPVAEEW